MCNCINDLIKYMAETEPDATDIKIEPTTKYPGEHFESFAGWLSFNHKFNGDTIKDQRGIYFRYCPICGIRYEEDLQ